MFGETMLEVDVYNVRLRFSRLFADPLFFEEPGKLPQRYLAFAGVPEDKTIFLHLTSSTVAPIDDSGRQSVVSGTGNYRYQGKRVRSEYMKNANLEFRYVDFGSGLSPEEHERTWMKGVWGGMRFQVKTFQHESTRIDLPDVTELYEMLRGRANPITMASVELTDIPDNLFQATFSFLEHQIELLSERNGYSVELYSARGLTDVERISLAKRLGRDSTGSTVHVILSKMPAQ